MPRIRDINIGLLFCATLLLGCSDDQPRNDPSPSVEIQLASPSGSAQINQRRPTFSWAPAQGASYYLLSLATEESFNGTAINETATDAPHILSAANELPASPCQAYYWKVTAYDAEGRVIGSSNTSSFLLDTVAPTGSMSINEGASTTPTEHLRLAYTYSDSCPSLQIRRSSDAGFASAEWQDAESTGSFIASEYANTANASITVHAQIRDSAGNVSSIISDSIALERTPVSGIIGAATTWRKADGPYVITGNTLVDDTASLTIEPGTQVLFNGEYYLKVRSVLKAIGTEAEKIVFSHAYENAPGSWLGIIFDYNSAGASFDSDGQYLAGCTLQHCVIQYGGRQDYANASGVYMDGTLYCLGPSVYIADSIIRENRMGIFGCGRIERNYIVDNEGMGLNGGNCVLTGNFISGNGIGARVTDAVVKNNDIVNNLGVGLVIGWDAQVTKNNIMNNAGEGIFGYWGRNTLSSNNISGNAFFSFTKNCKKYSYDSTLGPDDDAKNNYWGTGSETEIADLIYDYYDSVGAYSKVIFSPIATSPVIDAGSGLPPIQ
jgi:hypothetical protein